MFQFVTWLRDSDYAFGLYPITSLDTLILGFDMWNNVIRIDETPEGFAITVYESHKDRSTREFTEDKIIPAFEKLISSLHWFREEMAK